jgi:hypothetical protein
MSGRVGLRQVGGSSGRPDPLVVDGCEHGRWGPKGTHVLHQEAKLKKKVAANKKAGEKEKKIIV